MDGFSVMASVFPFLFFIVFGIILIVFVVTFVRGIGEWHKNNNAPRITVPAKVVSNLRYLGKVSSLDANS